MSETNVGANLVFALRTTIVCEPMSVANVSNSFLNIGLISVFVRRANIRFAPTLVLLIGLIPVFVRRALCFPNLYIRPYPIAVRLSANTIWCSFPGSAWERFPRWLCHLRTEQAAGAHSQKVGRKIRNWLSSCRLNTKLEITLLIN